MVVAGRSFLSPGVGKTTPWKMNIAVIGVLLLVTWGYVYWQILQARRIFFAHVRDNAAMLAAVVRESANSAVLSQQIIEQIMKTYLGNSIRFVDYLDAIEPFHPNELTIFAQEAGLAGISIIGAQSPAVGPLQWAGVHLFSCAQADGILHHTESDPLYYMGRPRASDVGGCIFVGLNAQPIQALEKQASLETMITGLSRINAIAYIRMQAASDMPSKQVHLVGVAGKQIAQTRISLGNKDLVVGMDARHFLSRADRLWQDFFVFSAMIALLGLFSLWLLHRFQQIHLKQIRKFERRLANQREDAALGRAAATIAHEIRNPLNAIGMGLQRLQIEADGLDDEHRSLVHAILQAVGRADGIVGNLRRYARPLAPTCQAVDLKKLIESLLALYAQAVADQGIRIDFSCPQAMLVTVDADLLTQALDNLIKNAIEAQPNGGDIRIRLHADAHWVHVKMENAGFDWKGNDPETILLPYVTTKTRGTGLGLAMVHKIVQAHGGELEIVLPTSDRIEMAIKLPKQQSCTVDLASAAHA